MITKIISIKHWSNKTDYLTRPRKIKQPTNWMIKNDCLSNQPKIIKQITGQDQLFGKVENN